MKKGTKRAITWTVIAVIIAAAIFMVAGKRKALQQVTYDTVPVEKGDVAYFVTATGTIEPVTEVEVGTQVSGIISNIYVDYNSIVKKGQVIAELDKIYQFLANNPSLRIEIGGHTDNTGSISFNQTLSLKRAQAVADYLVQRGIHPDRITAAGYGFDKPIGDNRTEEGRAKNRRTELKII